MNREIERYNPERPKPKYIILTPPPKPTQVQAPRTQIQQARPRKALEFKIPLGTKEEFGSNSYTPSNFAPSVSAPGSFAHRSSTSSTLDKTQEIWTANKKNKALNEDATRVFLQSMKEVWTKFCDKKTVKKDVFKELGMKMESHGFNLGTDCIEKTKERWRYLQNSYKTYVVKLEQTGQGGEVLDEEPPFFPELEDLLGGVHAVHPVRVVDSMDSHTDWDSESSSNSESQGKRKGKRVGKSVTKKRMRDSEKVVESLENIRKEEREWRKSKEKASKEKELEKKKRHDQRMELGEKYLQAILDLRRGSERSRRHRSRSPFD